MKNLTILLCLCVPAALGNSVFLAQNASGNGSGISCQNPLAYSYFNSAAHWAANVQPSGFLIGPGTIVHVCGTLTAGAGTSGMLQFQGSGTASNPITLVFDGLNGSMITAPYWGTQGAIAAVNVSYIVIDGHAVTGNNFYNEGRVKASACGTASNSIACTNGAAVYFSNCTNCTVKNLNVGPIYLRQDYTPGDEGGEGTTGIFATGSSGLVLQGNTISDVAAAIRILYGPATSSLTVSGNNLSNCDQAISIMDAGANAALTGTNLIFANLGHDFSVWNDAQKNFAHSFLSVAAWNPGSTVSGLQIYGNESRGKVSGYNLLSLSGSGITGALIANNVLANNDNTHPVAYAILNSATNTSIYNNTLIANWAHVFGGTCIANSGAGLALENNICQNASVGFSSTVPAANDYNGYFRVANTAAETHSISNDPGIDINYHLLPGAAGIGTGTNLSSLGIPSLMTDFQGAIRPTVGNWDIGAFKAYAPFDPPAPYAAQGFSTAPKPITVQLFRDPSLTIPTYGAAQTERIYGLLSAPAITVAPYGRFQGTLSTLDATHIQYDAPPSLLPAHAVDGLQPVPNDLFWFTRVDKLPLYSSHYTQDGSGYCEAGGKFNVFCQGDPYSGTGAWRMLGPIGSTCLSTTGSPIGAPIGVPGSMFDCHVSQNQVPGSPGPTTQATISDQTERFTWFPQPVYGGLIQRVAFPDLRYHAYEHREAGVANNPAWPCNGVGINSTVYPLWTYTNCPLGAPTPFATGPGVDAHIYWFSPKTWQTFEIYNDWLFSNGMMGCNAAASGYICDVQSARTLSWKDYSHHFVSAMGDTSTLEDQVEYTEEDLWRLIDGHPIQHGTVMTRGLAYCLSPVAGSPPQWPAVFNGNFCALNKWNATAPFMGSVRRLNPNRANITGATAIAVPSLGSGYPPGTVLTGTFGCSSIDGVTPPTVIAYIGQNGSVNMASVPFAWIVNTGKNCTLRTPYPVTFLPPPAGAVAPIVNVHAMDWNSFDPTPGNGAILAQGLFDNLAQYPQQLDDLGGNDQVRMEPHLALSPEFKAFSNFFSPSGFVNDFLYDWVDVSSLPPSGNGWPAMNTMSWLVDSANPLADPAFSQQIVKLTGLDGSISYSPIPVIGVGIGFHFGGSANMISIASNVTAPVDLGRYTYVTGDTANAGVVYTLVNDPCPGSDSLSATGLYVPCPQFNGTAAKTGRVRAASLANAGAYTYIYVTILPVASDGSIHFDVGGNGGCALNANFTPGVACGSTGITWMGECKHCIEVYSQSHPGWNGGNDGAQGDNTWTYSRWGGPHAPLSTPAERSIYQTYRIDGELQMPIYVNNGQYSVRNMFAIHGPQPGTTSVYSTGSVLIAINGAVTRWSTCEWCDLANVRQQPWDSFDPGLVTTNELVIRYSSFSPYTYQGEFQYTNANHSGNNLYEWSGFSVTPDCSAPRWEIGSWIPGTNGAAPNAAGDSFRISGVNDGTAHILMGQTSPGILQLYIRDWYTGLTDLSRIVGGSPMPFGEVTDAIWSVIRGSGAISPTGLYVAPTTASAPSDCTFVQAQSASQPDIVAHATICMAGSGQFAVH